MKINIITEVTPYEKAVTFAGFFVYTLNIMSNKVKKKTGTRGRVRKGLQIPMDGLTGLTGLT